MSPADWASWAATCVSAATLDPERRMVLERAIRTQGKGPDAFTAVLDAVRTTADLDAQVVDPFVTRLWFTAWAFPPTEEVVEREAAWVRETSARTFPTSEGLLDGFEAGDGPTVLLVHGWGDHAARLGAFISPLTSKGCRIIGVDLPGHGSDDTQTDLYRVVTAVSEVIAAERVCAVVAHSMGAQAVVKAVEGGAAVDALALMAPAVRLRSAAARFGELFSLPDRVMDVLICGIEHRYGAGVWADTDADRAASSVQAPVLVAVSDDDEMVSFPDIAALVEELPQVRTEHHVGLGHNRLLRAPDVLESVSRFLADTIVG